MKKNYYSAYNPSDYDWAKFYYLNRPLTITEEYSKKMEDQQGTVILSSSLNQETSLIAKDNFQKLSAEAKEIIMTVLNTPDELLNVLTTPTGKFCRRYIVRYFKKKKKWNMKTTERIFGEVVEYVNEL